MGCIWYSHYAQHCSIIDLQVIVDVNQIQTNIDNAILKNILFQSEEMIIGVFFESMGVFFQIIIPPNIKYHHIEMSTLTK